MNEFKPLVGQAEVIAVSQKVVAHRTALYRNASRAYIKAELTDRDNTDLLGR
jgi:hypothetical protein